MIHSAVGGRSSSLVAAMIHSAVGGRSSSLVAVMIHSAVGGRLSCLVAAALVHLVAVASKNNFADDLVCFSEFSADTKQKQ